MEHVYLRRCHMKGEENGPVLWEMEKKNEWLERLKRRENGMVMIKGSGNGEKKIVTDGKIEEKENGMMGIIEKWK